MIKMRFENEKQKRTVLCIAAILLTVCFIVLSFRIIQIVDRFFDRTDPYLDDTYAYENGGHPRYLVNGTWYTRKGCVETILLIGVDKYESVLRQDKGNRNQQQSDALFLLAVDCRNETYRLIHINRDTMVKIHMLDMNGNVYNDFVGQLALSHTYGTGSNDSCLNTVSSVSDFLYGLQIDHYASVSMDAVGILNDMIGGVTLTVLDDMTVLNESFVKGSEVTLKGENALQYIRARQSLEDSTNVARMKRQRQYVTAFLEQAKKKISEDSVLAYRILDKVSEYLVSDLSLNDLAVFSDILNQYTFDGIYTIDGKTRKGNQFIEFYPDEARLQELILNMFYEID